jgi:hypothetical protein
VERKMHVCVQRLLGAEVLLQKTIRRPGQQMLNDELTTKLSKIQGKKSVEYGKSSMRYERKWKGW